MRFEDRRLNQEQNDPLKPLEEIGNEWFVNRQQYLDYFWTWGNSIPLPGGNSMNWP